MPALCPLWGCWQDSHRMAAARTIRRHWTALCLGGNGAGGNPQGYATVPLPDHRYLIIIGRHWDFLKLIPWEYVRVCAGVLSPGTSLHNGTARSGLMPCMGGPVHGWSVSSRKKGRSAGIFAFHRFIRQKYIAIIS